MSLQFPNRWVWLFIGIVILFLLQSGCTPIQPPAAAEATVASDESARASLSTSIDVEATSPDGAWTATSLLQIPRGSEEYYQSLIVAHASGSPSYTLVDSWSPLAMGYTVAEPLTWSQDSSRFYYTNRPQADGCGLLYNGSDLIQVDLATGETQEILPANTTTRIGLAPDEQHIAYHAIGETTLVIHGLDSDESATFDLSPIVGDGQAGAFVWSPDSSAVTIVVAHNPCVDGWAEATSIYILDVETMSLTPILEQDDRLLSPAAWPTDEELLLTNPDSEAFTLDLATGTVTPAASSTMTSTVTTPITATETVTQ